MDLSEVGEVWAVEFGRRRATSTTLPYLALLPRDPGRPSHPGQVWCMGCI
jgi:hypothetical protein